MSAVGEHRSESVPSPSVLPAQDDDEAMDDDLPQCKIKRNYSCNLCSFFSQNPRSFLYHSRDVHFDKIKIYECSKCLYASKHSQKLQRHVNMIHVAGKTRPKKTIIKKISEKKEIKPLPYMLQPEVQLEVEDVTDIPEGETELKCSMCNFSSRSAGLMRRHERVVHLKKRFLRCTKCSYVTHVKARFTKHVKYHSMPMIKCDLCDFRTPYKWNLDRHYKNHCGTGAFQCSKCNFRADIKQSLTVHEINHHVPAAGTAPTHPRRKRNMVGASETTAFESDGIDQDELELLRLEREDEEGLIKTESLSDADDEEPDLNADDPIPMEPLVKQPKSSEVQNNDIFLHPSHIMDRPNHVKTVKCKFCSYKSNNSQDVWRHQKRIHGFVRGKRPPPNLIPIQGKPASPILKIPDVRTKRSPIEDPTPPVNEEEFNEMCKKSSLTSSLKEFVSLIGDEDGLKTIPDASVNTECKETDFDEENMEDFDDSKKYQTDLMKRKNATFFDKIKEKLVNGGSEECNLVCELCGHESKCLSESIAHEKRHAAEKDELILPGTELSSTRCQHCRQRCKTSQDLVNHLMACRAFNAAYGNQEIETCVKEESSDSTMENRVFVWNDFPLEGKEEPDAEGDVDQTSSSCLGEVRDPLQPPRLAPAPRTLQSHPHHSGPAMKKVFKCPHCSFWASTASRFHVHIVGHLNKKPFECSLCNYRSNWRWDITKHIRLKSARDPSHAQATVNMTDETGRRNYSKYNKYLTMMKVHEPTADSSGTGRRTRACEATQGTVSEEDILGPIPAPPQLTRAPTPGSTNHKLPQGAPLRPPPPLQAAHTATGASKRTLWKCKKCLYRNSNKEKVLAHVKSHYESVTSAGDSANSDDESTTDMLPVGEEPVARNPYKCGHCYQVSNWRHVIQRHCKLKHNGDVKIASCTEEDSDRPSLDKKTASDSVENPGSGGDPPLVACDICPFTADSAGDLTAHKLNHVDRPGSIFKCTYCPFYVPSKIAVLEHMEIHGAASAVDVNALKIDSFDPSEYRNQIEGEPDVEKRYQCRQCPYVSNSRTQFLYHKQFHRPRNAPFKCLYCSYNVSRRHLLHQHLRVHHTYKVGETTPEAEEELPDIPLVWVNRGGSYLKMYKCRWCPHINIRRVNIQEHEKMHKDSCKHHCPDCSYTCNNPGVLSSHVKVHTGFYGEIRSLVDPTRTDADQIKSLKNTETFVEPEVLLKVEEQDPEQSTPESSYYQSSTAEEVALSDDASTKLVNFCNKCPARFLNLKELRIHWKFHLIRLPFKCDFCTYTARQRPHLLAHLKVHGQEYQEKTASLVDTYMVAPENPRPKTTLISKESEFIAGPIWAVMALDSTNSVREIKPPAKPQAKHACHRCPAKFFKPVALQYHLTLHGGSHQHRCKYCDYTVKTYGNLIKHQLVHENIDCPSAENQPVDPLAEGEDRLRSCSKKTDPQFGELMHGSPDFIYPTYVKNGKLKEKRYKCHKCPSAFEKRDQYRIHLSLHGSKQKYMCEKCDYSVKYYANYIQHMKKHQYNEEAKLALDVNIKTDVKDESCCYTPTTPPPMELSMMEKQSLLLERKMKQERELLERKVFCCDMCPYTSYRKDCLENHERRHFQKSATHHGSDCHHCDYSTSQVNFLREHIKLHFKPSARHHVDAYLKVDNLELWCIDEENANDPGYPIFKDTGEDGPERFFPLLPINQSHETEENDTKIFINPLNWEQLTDEDESKVGESIKENPPNSDELLDFDLCGEDLIEMIEEQCEVERPKVKRMRGKNWRCKKCPHAFGKRDQYLRHIALHGSNQRYSCDACDYSVKFYTNYVQHMRMHQSHEPDRVIHIRQYVPSPDRVHTDDLSSKTKPEINDEIKLIEKKENDDIEFLGESSHLSEDSLEKMEVNLCSIDEHTSSDSEYIKSEQISDFVETSMAESEEDDTP